MENVTEAQVSNLFRNLDTNKSSIGIPNKLIKIPAEPSLKNIAFCISINLDLGRGTPLSRPS